MKAAEVSDPVYQLSSELLTGLVDEGEVGDTDLSNPNTFYRYDLTLNELPV